MFYKNVKLAFCKQVQHRCNKQTGSHMRQCRRLASAFTLLQLSSWMAMLQRSPLTKR